jgi:hypothetical protein
MYTFSLRGEESMPVLKEDGRRVVEQGLKLQWGDGVLLLAELRGQSVRGPIDMTTQTMFSCPLDASTMLLAM